MIYLVKFEKNWADEFDVSGFEIMNEARLNFLKEVFADPQPYGFGTNQDFDDVSIDDFKIVELALEDVDPLYRSFPSGSFGFFPDIDFMNEMKEFDNTEKEDPIDLPDHDRFLELIEITERLIASYK